MPFEDNDEDEVVHDNQLVAILSKLKGVKSCYMSVGGRGSDCCLIYIALSKDKEESSSHLKRQLQFMHSLLISAGTNHLIESLKANPNHDILNVDQVREVFIPQLYH